MCWRDLLIIGEHKQNCALILLVLRWCGEARARSNTATNRPANINTTRVHLPVWWWDAAGKCENRYQQTPVLLDTDPDGLLRAANCTRHSAAAFNTALGLLTRNNACSMQPLESCV